MKVYIAGPYTIGDPVLNIRQAIHVANQIAAAGGFPFVPHLSHLWHIISPHNYEFWLVQDMEWLEACDAVYRIPGESKGADREVAKAVEFDMPVYHDLEELLAGLRRVQTT